MWCCNVIVSKNRQVEFQVHERSACKAQVEWKPNDRQAMSAVVRGCSFGFGQLAKTLHECASKEWSGICHPEAPKPHVS